MLVVASLVDRFRDAWPFPECHSRASNLPGQPARMREGSPKAPRRTAPWGFSRNLHKTLPLGQGR